jgi:hypothetical protein
LRDTNGKTIVAEYALPSGVEIKDIEGELSGKESEKLQHELELSGLLKVDTLG